MTKKTAKPSNPDTHDKSSNLDSRYGSIGIPAVAAALQFKRDVKQPACSPAGTSDEKKHPDMAA